MAGIVLGLPPRDSTAVTGGMLRRRTDARHHQPFREILDSGWADAYDERGSGLDSTWPVRGVPLSFYRLDHVLVTDHFQIESMEVSDLPGSDHKPLLVSVEVREDPAAGGANTDVAGRTR